MFPVALTNHCLGTGLEEMAAMAVDRVVMVAAPTEEARGDMEGDKVATAREEVRANYSFKNRFNSQDF